MCFSCQSLINVHVLESRTWVCSGCGTELFQSILEGGTIYVLSNESMPGTLKIGKTERPINQRIDELQTTGVPTPFMCEALFASNDYDSDERRIHKEFKACRVHPAREFFKLSREDAVLKISDLLGHLPFFRNFSLRTVAEIETNRQLEKEAQAVAPHILSILAKFKDTSYPNSRLKEIALDNTGDPIEQLAAGSIYLHQFPGDMEILPTIARLTHENHALAKAVWPYLKSLK